MPRSKPAKKEEPKKQPAQGKVEKVSKKEEKAPQKGVQKVAQVSPQRAVQSVKAPAKGKKVVAAKQVPVKKQSPAKGKKAVVEESEDDEDMSSSGEDYQAEGSSEDSSEDYSFDADGDAEMEDGDVSAKVFVGNLAWTVKDADIKKFFKDCGTVVHVHLRNNKNGKFSGVGFATFQNPDQAAKAFSKDGKELLGRPVKIKSALPPQATFKLNPPSPILFVTGLATGVTDSELRAAFPTATEVRITPKGAAFVEFKGLGASAKALEAAPSVSVMGRAIHVEYAKPRNPDSDSGTKSNPQRKSREAEKVREPFHTPKPAGGCTIFVGGLPPDTKEEEIKTAFKGCEIENIRLVKKKGHAKGVAFVQFRDSEVADQAEKIAKEGKVTIKERRPRFDWAEGPKPKA